MSDRGDKFDTSGAKEVEMENVIGRLYLDKRESSKLLSVILKSFCCLVSSAFSSSRSGRSAFTTSASN